MLAACFVIVVAGMKASADIIVPFLLALFIAIICGSPLAWMKRRRVPTALAIVAILLVVSIAGLVIITIIGTSVNSLSDKLPAYQALFAERASALVAWLRGQGLEVSDSLFSKHFDPGAIMKMVTQLFMGLSGVLTNAVLIMLTVVLILIEATELPRKSRAALPKPEQTLGRAADALTGINNYLAIKTLFSALTGICVGLLLWAIGVDFPLLWGLLAFLLNFIPNVGSIIAAIPPILLALIQLGLMPALLAAAGFVAINFAFGNFLEVRMMGRHLGLSTLVVFLSLVVWGWILGPVGMFLSVPLTMVLKIALENNARTRWIGILLGSTPIRV